MTYPDAHNLSGCAQPIRIVLRQAASGDPERLPCRGEATARPGTSNHAPLVRSASTGYKAWPPPNVACNSIGRRFNKVRKRCNSNAANSRFEMVTRELHAKLVGYSVIQRHKNWGEVDLAEQRVPRTTPHQCGGGRRGRRAWPGFEPTRRAKLVARTVSGRARRRPEHRWRSQQEHRWRSQQEHRCAASRNTGSTKKPGGGTPPPGLYARLTFP